MNTVLTLVTQTITMFLLAGVGYALFRTGKITPEGNKVLGNLLIHIALPCVIINSFIVAFPLANTPLWPPPSPLLPKSAVPARDATCAPASANSGATPACARRRNRSTRLPCRRAASRWMKLCALKIPPGRSSASHGRNA